jgi:hypothetical protein
MTPPAAGPADSLYADEVARARAMAPADKLLEGPRLFERACRLMRDGIRHQHPAFSDEAVDVLLAARLARLDDLARR